LYGQISLVTVYTGENPLGFASVTSGSSFLAVTLIVALVARRSPTEVMPPTDRNDSRLEMSPRTPRKHCRKTGDCNPNGSSLNRRHLLKLASFVLHTGQRSGQKRRYVLSLRCRLRARRVAQGTAKSATEAQNQPKRIGEELVNALQRMKAVGHVEITRTLGNHRSYVKMIPTPTGRKIIFLTNRQIRSSINRASCKGI
jgi:hypothetical protein